MDRITVLKRLLHIARAGGWDDELRPLAPAQQEGEYEEWLIASGAYRRIVFDLSFLAPVQEFLVENDLPGTTPDEPVEPFAKRIIKELDPLEGSMRDALVKIGERDEEGESILPEDNEDAQV